MQEGVCELGLCWEGWEGGSAQNSNIFFCGESEYVLLERFSYLTAIAQDWETTNHVVYLNSGTGSSLNFYFSLEIYVELDA